MLQFNQRYIVCVPFFITLLVYVYKDVGIFSRDTQMNRQEYMNLNLTLTEVNFGIEIRSL